MTSFVKECGPGLHHGVAIQRPMKNLTGRVNLLSDAPMGSQSENDFGEEAEATRKIDGRSP